jgi:hypothetical protein
MASVAFSLTTGSSDTNNTAIGAPIENSNVLKKIAPWHTSDSSFRLSVSYILFFFLDFTDNFTFNSNCSTGYNGDRVMIPLPNL